jgi:hypothetical protein
MVGDVLLNRSELGGSGMDVGQGSGCNSGIVGGILAPVLTLNGLVGLVGDCRLGLLAIRGRLVLQVCLGSSTTRGLGGSTLDTLRSRHGNE